MTAVDTRLQTIAKDGPYNTVACTTALELTERCGAARADARQLVAASSLAS